MWPAANLVNRRVFMELGKSQTNWGSSRDWRCTKWNGLKVKGDKYKQKNRGERRGKQRKEREGDEDKKKRKENDGFSTSGFEWSLSFEGEFPKVLKEVIPSFKGRKERRQRGSNRVSYRYEHCMLLPFLLDSACLCL